MSILRQREKRGRGQGRKSVEGRHGKEAGQEVREEDRAVRQ